MKIIPHIRKTTNNFGLGAFITLVLSILIFVLTILRLVQPTSMLTLVTVFCFLLLFFAVGIDTVFIFAILLLFVPINFMFAKVEGWDLNDIILPILLIYFLFRKIWRHKTLTRIPPFSLPILLFFLIAFMHILTLRELPEIAGDIVNLTVPKGGYRIFYDLLLSGIIYFITPFILIREEQIRGPIFLLLGMFLLVIVISMLRIGLGWETMATSESYSTRLHYINTGQETVTRVGILGVAGYWLYLIGLIFFQQHSIKLFLSLVCISIASILLSGGRAPFISLVLSTSFFLYFRGRKVFAIIPNILLLLTLLFFGLNNQYLVSLPPILQRPLGLFSPDNPSYSDGNTRKEMWTIALKKISSDPLWGKQYIENSNRFDEGALANVQRGGAHNVYLSTAASFGMPALFLWLMAAISYYKKIVHLYRISSSFQLLNKFCLLLAIFLGTSFITYLFEGGAGGGVKYFLTLGLIDSAYNIYGQKELTKTK